MTTKERVLNYLLHDNNFISGTYLADKLQLSRNAIWKAINQLKKDGHHIVTSPAGYHLIQTNNTLNQAIIQASLPFTVLVYDSIDSTNTQAKRLADSLDRTTLFIAKQQTHGRGRFGKTFYSPKDNGLYMSLLYRAEHLKTNLSLITPLVAVAIVKAIQTLTQKTAAIKWVNDIFYRHKKIAGILTEAITNVETGELDWIIIGMGINVYRDSHLPKELESIVGYLSDEQIDMNTLVCTIITELITLLEKLPDTQFLEYYRQHCFILNKNITVHTKQREPFIARALAITEHGELLIETLDGAQEILQHGEISTRLENNYAD